MKPLTKLLLILFTSVYLSSCEKDKLETVTDADGNVYSTVVIGTQIWMSENLKTTKFNDGADIPLVTDYTEWGNLTSPGYCWCNNNEEIYGGIYGALYNWYSVNTGKLCPDGWHVPSDEEWKVLEMYLGMSQVEADKIGHRGTDEGTKLMMEDIWLQNGTDYGTNESGFSALPGGYRSSDGYFYYIGGSSDWWTSTELDAHDAWTRRLLHDPFVYRDKSVKENGLSVRCLKDN